MNGGETGVDCGGPDCAACNGCSFELAYEDNFENGYGNWQDGGLNCRRQIDDALYAASGDYCVRLTKNTSTSRVITHNLILSDFESVRLDFNFMTHSMDTPTSERFYLQMSLNGGLNFIYPTVKTWIKGNHFENNIRYNESVGIIAPTSGFTDETRFRFKCNADDTAADDYEDWVFLDDIQIFGCRPQPIPRAIPDFIPQDAISIHAYPNPTKDKFQVEVNSPFDSKASFEIINIDGKSMYESQLNLRKGQNTQDVDISKYPTGIYTIVVSTKDSNETLKIVKL